MENKIEDDILILIKKLNKYISQDFDKRLAEYDLTSQQGRMLFLLSKNERDGINTHQKDLEKITTLSKSTISGLLERLEKKGLIIRIPDPPFQIIKPSDKGNNIVDNIFSHRTETINKLFKNKTNQEQSFIVQEIQQLISNIKED